MDDSIAGMKHGDSRMYTNVLPDDNAREFQDLLDAGRVLGSINVALLTHPTDPGLTVLRIVPGPGPDKSSAFGNHVIDLLIAMWLLKQ